MPLIYLGAKLIIYTLWCYVGMRLFRSPRLLSVSYVSPFDLSATDDVVSVSRGVALKQAVLFGFFRLGMGLLFGAIAIVIGSALVGAVASTFDKRLLLYVLFLMPARSVEWWVTARLIGTTSPSAPVLLWAFGGTLLSCLMDIPTSFAVTDVFGFC